MEKLQRLATALIVIFYYLEAENFPQIAGHSIGSSGTRNYCGTQLNEALIEICAGRFNHRIRDPEERGRRGDLWPGIRFMSADEARSPFPRGLKRNRRGIVDECCRNQCSTAELMSYCELGD